MVQDNVGQTIDELMARATFDADGNLKDWYMTGRTTDILTLIWQYNDPNTILLCPEQKYNNTEMRVHNVVGFKARDRANGS